MEIKKQLIAINYTKGTNKPKYIVIHNTDNKTADAQQHYKYWNTNNGANSSAHYVVDDREIIHLVEHDNSAWHCGKKYGQAEIMECNNNNSIGIEICNHTACNFDKAMDNAIELVKKLMKDLNIPIERVISHKQACNKNCPSTILKLNKWDWFKEQLIDKEPQVFWRVITSSHEDINLAKKEMEELKSKGYKNTFIAKFIKEVE